MARLLDELLDVSRMTQNKLQLRKRPFDLRRSAEDSIAAVEARLRDAHLELTCRIADEPICVNGDPARLQQVITNLLDNALKYTPSGGRVWLSVQSEEGQAVVRVKDNGIGIEPSLLEKVFDLFMQTERTLDRSAGGMGVGLTLVRSLVELHGGHVEAYSGGSGCGSEFVFRLPLAAAVLSSGHPETEPLVSGAGEGKLVVVVDDDADNRDMLTALLQLHGYHVRAAASGREGLDLLEQFRPQAALIDIGLPGMSGYEVAEHVRRNLADDQIYLVAVTGYGQREDVQQALERGFDRHIVKPLTIEKLREVLANCSSARPHKVDSGGKPSELVVSEPR
jgi:two-component system CheB/CheR fusion protein